MENLPTLREQHVWRGTYNKIPFKISQHGVGETYMPAGCWCYYLILPEYLLKERFAEVWLEDKLVKFTDVSPERVTHDYYPLDNFDMHGGITYYEKHGHSVGHRSVELGCDYQHLFDRERGYTDYNMVLKDCLNSCELAAKHFELDQTKNIVISQA